MTFRTLLTSLLSVVFGLLYPAFGSITAIESSVGADDTQWLVYWLIFSLLSISESLLWPVLKWLPLYQELKIALLVWLVLPQTQGALWVYENLLHPGWEVLRKELVKVPALENTLRRAGVASSDTHDRPQSAAESSKNREAAFESAVLGVTSRMQTELKGINSTSDPAARARSERQFDKDLAKLSKLAGRTKAF